MMISNLKDAVLRDIAGMLNNSQLKRLELSLSLRLAVAIADEELKWLIKAPNAEALLAKFFAAKRVEGCSERTLKVYREELAPVLNGPAVSMVEMIQRIFHSFEHYNHGALYSSPEEMGFTARVLIN